MRPYRTLKELNPGETGVVSSLQMQGSLRRRFLDIGLIADTPVLCLGRSPGGDPAAYLIRGAVIAIRGKDSKDVWLKEA